MTLKFNHFFRLRSPLDMTIMLYRNLASSVKFLKMAELYDVQFTLTNRNVAVLMGSFELSTHCIPALTN